MNTLELAELEALEDLKLAIHMVKQRADAINDDAEDDYIEDYGGMAEICMRPLTSACRILLECKRRHIHAENEYMRDQQERLAVHEKEQADQLFRRRQQAAHSAVAAALARGDLIRLQKCERCPSTPEDIVAHHHDYDAPLDVEWLCRPCHGKHHAEHGPAKCTA